MTTWHYYDAIDGYLYDENGNRERMDGRKRTAEQWQAYLERNDIRGTVR